MSKQRLKDAALTQFAKKGYEGASLADIASEVGIKKQSIYTHFAGKDELYLEVFQEALHEEFRFVQHFLGQSRTCQQLLIEFLQEYKLRYEQEDHTKFFLRTAFFPPCHMDQSIMAMCNKHVENIELAMEVLFAHGIEAGEISPEVGASQAAVAFSALLDSVFVELLYGEEKRVDKRITSAWHIFWRGVKA